MLVLVYIFFPSHIPTIVVHMSRKPIELARKPFLVKLSIISKNIIIWDDRDF